MVRFTIKFANIRDGDVNKNNKVATVKAPTICSLIDQPENTIRFFREAESAYSSGKNVIYDLSQCTRFTDTSIALLTAHLKDRNINKGRISNLVYPIDSSCEKKLKQRGVLKKFSENAEEIAFNDHKVTKVSNTIVANYLAKELSDKVSNYLFGEGRQLKSLYSILIELMANTNNHADLHDRGSFPWWISIYNEPELKKIKFVFIDLGMGIFKSIPVKQYMVNNPLNILTLEATNHTIIRGLKISQIFTALSTGKITSSTGDPARGRGIPLISKHAQSGVFSAFKLISNDAYIDMTTQETSVMNENFSGTLFFFELTGP